MTIERLVWCTLSFEHFHKWPGAASHPDVDVHFLSFPHRHIFHVKMYWLVNHSDREIEFITQKRKVEETIELTKLDEILSTDPALPVNTVDWSCEHWCLHLLNCFPTACEVTVSEDLENGATVRRLD